MSPILWRDLTDAVHWTIACPRNPQGVSTGPMSKTDALKQFASLREALIKEKTKLEAHVAAIDEALGSVQATQVRVPRVYNRRPRAGAAASGPGRRGNPSSLKQMILDATKDKPLKRDEILEAVLKAGYKFATKDPLNSLSTTLYTAKEFKKYGKGVFGPA